MTSKPKCYGQMLRYAGMGGCGECSLVADCAVESKNKIIQKYTISNNRKDN